MADYLTEIAGYNRMWGRDKIMPRDASPEDRAMKSKLRDAIALIQQAEHILTGVNGTLDDCGDDYLTAALDTEEVRDALGSHIGALLGVIKEIEAVPEIEAERAEDARYCGEGSA